MWTGFVNDTPLDPCVEEATGRCFGGATPESHWLLFVARMISVLGMDAASEDHLQRGQTFPHPYLTQTGAHPVMEKDKPTERDYPSRSAYAEAMRDYLNPKPMPMGGPRLLEALKGLGATGGISDDYEMIYKKLKEISNLPESWGRCRACNGRGRTPESAAASDAWKPTQPPTGPGYQLWETVSEGSPISRVYKTEQKFIAYLISQGYSRTAAERFCESGWAPSGAIHNGQSFKDIESLDLE